MVCWSVGVLVLGLVQIVLAESNSNTGPRTIRSVAQSHNLISWINNGHRCWRKRKRDEAARSKREETFTGRDRDGTVEEWTGTRRRKTRRIDYYPHVAWHRYVELHWECSRPLTNIISIFAFSSIRFLCFRDPRSVALAPSSLPPLVRIYVILNIIGLFALVRHHRDGHPRRRCLYYYYYNLLFHLLFAWRTPRDRSSWRRRWMERLSKQLV